jgi:hypothetical protein
MENWLVLQNFYRGLTPMLKGHVDATAGGAFLSLTIDRAMSLIKKMVANQSRGEEQKLQKGMHIMKEADMLAAKKIVMEKTEQTGPRERSHEGHRSGHRLVNDL